jgi:hypothetical protein
MNIIFILTTLLHVQFAGVGWFYRYEAYLVAMGIIALTLSSNELGVREIGLNVMKNISFKPECIITWLIILLTLPLFLIRAAKSLVETPAAAHERYIEHVLPGFFLKENPQYSPVVVNDVGAISYYSDVKILDIYGIASIEPIIYRKKGYDASDVREWANRQGAVLAYLQIQWREVYPRIPDELKVVEEWRISENVVFGDTIFTWYCIKPGYEPRLRKDLKDFSKRLPRNPALKVNDSLLDF